MLVTLANSKPLIMLIIRSKNDSYFKDTVSVTRNQSISTLKKKKKKEIWHLEPEGTWLSTQMRELHS